MTSHSSCAPGAALPNSVTSRSPITNASPGRDATTRNPSAAIASRTARADRAGMTIGTSRASIASDGRFT
ncbi:MAG TPA: hypothetical protein VFD36_08045 [Kofleriaceae bacterium]|nr:hypothetical protein [Kofleriaceae bacterium]